MGDVKKRNEHHHYVMVFAWSVSCTPMLMSWSTVVTSDISIHNNSLSRSIPFLVVIVVTLVHILRTLFVKRFVVARRPPPADDTVVMVGKNSNKKKAKEEEERGC